VYKKFIQDTACIISSESSEFFKGDVTQTFDALFSESECSISILNTPVCHSDSLFAYSSTCIASIGQRVIGKLKENLSCYISSVITRLI